MNECIQPGSKFGKQFGFTSNKFGGYLWIDDNVIYLSLIISKQQNQGHTKQLIQTIIDHGYSIICPSPNNIMTKICKDFSFKPAAITDVDCYFYENKIKI